MSDANSSDPERSENDSSNLKKVVNIQNLQQRIRKLEGNDSSNVKKDSLENSLGQELPMEGRLGGIDFGTVRIGLATCDPSQTWATPYQTYTRRTIELDAAFFSELAENESLVGWVIGLPVHCDGHESQKSLEVRKFAVWLHSSSRLPYRFFDERFSTAEARRLLQETGLSSRKRKMQVDRIAAHLILSHYLGSKEQGLSQFDALDDGPDRPHPPFG